MCVFEAWRWFFYFLFFPKTVDLPLPYSYLSSQVHRKPTTSHDCIELLQQARLDSFQCLPVQCYTPWCLRHGSRRLSCFHPSDVEFIFILVCFDWNSLYRVVCAWSFFPFFFLFKNNDNNICILCFAGCIKKALHVHLLQGRVYSECFEE